MSGGTTLASSDATYSNDATSSEAYRTMFEDCYARVHAYCSRRVPPGVDTDDVVAETFRTAWRRFEDIPEERSLSWLFGTARRVVANEVRAERRRQALAERLRWTHVVPATTEPLISRNDDPRLDVLATALEALGERDTEILAMREWDDLSHREIARELGVAETTVAVRLHRARRRLRTAYERRIARIGASAI